ncbi:MAG: XRE family transcriptional regulator [Mesorhizobium sp.]|uniref:XRE family transcriptional regulator n=1 Tax=Mesorhizobium sp. TaxID=1871066 RepID=UPI000FE7132D|nr:XRE family transcriptional regulator [Mesorhizobium sp.]RWK85290.1 MAG: XRE family transcriptional regulator [Mesorhizobium sp.]
MTHSETRPYANTRLAKFVERRILELRPKKTQSAIASEAGFSQHTMLVNIKMGTSKLPLDRVPALAKALDCDAAMLFMLAVEQLGNDATGVAIRRIFGTLVTANEADWLEEIRDASGHTDPSLTSKARSAIRGIFGK